MSGLGDLDGVSEENSEITTDDSDQSKTLVFHSYSNRGLNEDDPYKKLDDWEELDDRQLNIAYGVSKPNGIVRETLDNTLPGYAGREEWYNHLQVELAHFLADRLGRDTFAAGDDQIETKGPVPLMELFEFRADDIVDYLSENEEMATEVLDTLKEAAEKAEEANVEAEPADD